MNSPTNQLPPDDSAEDIGLDCMLEELLAGQSPPSQKDLILRRLRTEVPASGDRSAAAKSRRASRERQSLRPLWAALAAIAAVVAMVVGVVATQGSGEESPDRIAGQPQRPNSGSAIATNLPPRPSAEPGATSSEFIADPSGRVEEKLASDDRRSKKNKKANQPPRSTPLPIRDSVPMLADGDRAPDPNTDSPAATRRASLPAMRLVSARMGDVVDEYWKDLSISPTAEISADQWRDRVAAQVGHRPSGDPDDLKTLVDWLQSDAVAAGVAERWMRELFAGLVKSADDKNKAVWLEQAAAAFRGSQRGDRLIADWISDPEHPIGSQANHASVIRLASIALDADLRCLKCHDGWNHVRGEQSDYWNLVALVRGSEKETFFETPDGRQEMATAKLPKALTDDGSAIGSLPELSQSRIGSRRVAGGLVDSLWRMVHGRSLRASTVDFRTATEHEAMKRLRDQLTEDLLASDFDLSRTLGLILSSKTNRRSVPKAFRGTGGLMADRGPAQRQIEAFAAAPPQTKRGSLADRIAFNLRRMGRTLDSSEGGLLAQVSDSASSDAKAKPADDAMDRFWDYPDATTDLPTTWLLAIKDRDQQIAHLAYLRGRDRAEDPLREADAQMRTDGISDKLRLQRLWWLVK